ncbi:MAG: glycosyltransferase family 4 protein [Anaerolineae bacterium]|nr:glycosyltransferase family 4 protein [Anaerolineae bacterium]
MPRVIYSNGARIAGGGIGNTSYHAVSGLHRHGILESLLCGSAKPTEIPQNKIRSLGVASRVFRKLAVYDPQNRLDYAYRLLYDRWASRQLTACDIFHGWSGYSLVTLRNAKAKSAITVLDRALAHPMVLDRLLQEEHEKYGIHYPKQRVAPRIKQEIDEADYVCIPSDFVRETFRAEGVPDAKLIQIPFGVDSARFQPYPRPAGEGFRALFVGQVSIRKGAHTLLEAWKKLGWQDAELWLAGRVDLPTPLLAQYRDMPGVRFLGHVSSIQGVFQQADVFVFPSLAEGSALVTYEAMASGLPVIVTLMLGRWRETARMGSSSQPEIQKLSLKA